MVVNSLYISIIYPEGAETKNFPIFSRDLIVSMVSVEEGILDVYREHIRW